MRVKDFGQRSLIDLLRDRAAGQPGDCAFTFLDDGERAGASITWRELELRSRAIAAGIMRHVQPGARVLVLFPPSADFVPAFFGVLYAGAIAVPAYPPAGARADRSITRLRGMIVDAGVSLVLAPSGLIAKTQGIDHALPELARIPWLDPAAVPDEDADEWRAQVVRSDSIAFLQYTSGSTSAPRGVMVTHGNLLHNLARTAADGGYGRDSISVSWLPINHDMGLINGILQPVFSGFPAYLMAPGAFLQRPARWLQAISRLGATHSGGPNFAYDLCARRVSDDDATTLDLGCWGVAYNGSEPVRRSTMETFQRRFGACGFRWESFSPAYGLAESTLLVTSVPAGAAPVLHGNAVASGMLDDESEVLIVDPLTRARLPQREVGEIWVSGGSVAAGYWNRSEETLATFHARLANSAESFLRTGDLGFIQNGCLFVTGRIKDVLIVRGMKHYPQDLELTAERAHPALRPGCCAAFALEQDGEERVAIVAEVEPREQTRGVATDFSQVLAAIRLAVASAHHVAPHIVSLVPAGAVPKTTSGKLQRFLCREALVNGTLGPLASSCSGDLAEAPKERRAS
ncbi:MAG TPA: fatty acyl-AMP ligase [Vicinamibacterales bacterium]|nr:fatty acyl-AMP ligase [Vicinamibacterales bacterium]